MTPTVTGSNQTAPFFGKKNYIACFTLAFLPAALFLGWLLFMKLTGVTVSATPTASDEMFWFHQITAMIDSGKPLGYYGYNGTHAPYGTFGPWGIAILIPYALWGKLFGFGIYSMCAANVTFLGAALCLFALMCRLTLSQTGFVAVGYSTLLMTLFYSVSSMAEPLRWSMAILLTGCIIRIHRGYCGKFFKYVFAPLLILYCAESFLLLSLFIPVYLMLVLPVRKLWLRLAAAAGITGALAVIMRKLLFLIVSPLYATGAPAPSTIFEAVQNKINGAFHVLRMVSPSGIWRSRGESHGFLSLFLLIFVLLLLLTLINVIRHRKTQHLPGFLLAFYLLLGALGGYCLIYKNPSLRTVCRGLNTALVCAVLLLCLYQSRKILLLLILTAVLSLPSFYLMAKDNLEQRSLTPEEFASYETALDEFDGLFDISEENTRWENTIAQYGARKPGMQTALSLALPRNAGYNVMRDTTVISEAGYAVVYRSFSSKEQYKAVISNLNSNGYSVIYKHEAMTILERTDHGS